MTSSDDPRTRRRADRARWPGRLVQLADEGGEDLSETTTAEERLGMMWQLALDAWASAGRPLPTYAREDAPGRVVRLHG